MATQETSINGLSSMDNLAHWLMREVCDDIKAENRGKWLDDLISEILKLRLNAPLRAAIGEFVEGGSPRGIRWWGAAALV